MIEEIRIFGVYMPSALFWAAIALTVTSLSHGLLLRVPLRQMLWHPALFDLAAFFLLWWGITRLADVWFPHGFFS
ncbi:DUF1656 domain-containing protein [Paraburkholderia tagetis]|uniref:DUF1656 domain-containing protein n=1 Tax=Paraburkholderia tagetis TaxID=2913261 RepID=A0A9X1UFV5_9BURK|nr:DUF1656 domain-containing protein [Paraburkholderia tagetis]MCG5071842.1 DUF1656 domain-containing protein [Paraburkholderia tagetis]